MPALAWLAGPDKLRCWFSGPWLAFTGRRPEQEHGLGWTEAVHAADIEPSLAQYLASAERREPYSAEYRLRRADGEYRWMLERAEPCYDEAGQFTGYAGCCLDITGRKQDEDHLRKLAEVLEQSSSSIVITDAKGRIQYVSPGFTRLSGYTLDESLGRTPGIVNSGTHSEAFYQEMWDTIRAGAVWRGEICNRKKSGAIYWERVSISPIRGGQGDIINFLALKIDITDRKIAEAALRAHEQELGELYAALQTVREDERRSLARELHDELGQVMTALRIDLNWLQQKLPPAPQVQAKLAAMEQLVDRTVDTVRRISEAMRPGMLDALGLSATLEHHAQKFEEQTGIVCGVAASHDDFGFDDQTAIAVFRIVQEALTNVARHAEASRVAISLSETGDEVLLVVQDNGRGMSEAPSERKTYGLLGMRERAAILGGRIVIASKPNLGVRIEVGIPKAGKGALT